MCSIRLVSTADSRPERLCVLLCESLSGLAVSPHVPYSCSRRWYPPAYQRKKRHPSSRPRLVAALKRTAEKIVATASDRRNTVGAQKVHVLRKHAMSFIPADTLYWLCKGLFQKLVSIVSTVKRCNGSHTSQSWESCMAPLSSKLL